MANLPNRPFLINYNARDYDSTTNSILKTQGQLFSEDAVLSYPPSDTHIEDGYITLKAYSYYGVMFPTASDNPFNRFNNQAGRTFTAVYKTSSQNFSGSENLFGNRSVVSDYNYMIRGTGIHTGDGLKPEPLFTPSTDPATMVVRVNADGSWERKCIETGEISTASTINWGGPSDGFALFAGYATGGEAFYGDFYWLYISNETLTDGEIQQVIAYNENSSVFYADPDSLSFDYEASSSTITLNADTEMSWTATSIPSWITLSSSAGTGTATITVSAAKNNTISPRTGTIVFSNGEDTAEVECTQAKHPLLVPFNNIYRNGLIN